MTTETLQKLNDAKFLLGIQIMGLKTLAAQASSRELISLAKELRDTDERALKAIHAAIQEEEK